MLRRATSRSSSASASGSFEHGVEAFVERGAERAREIAALESLRAAARMDLGRLARARATVRAQSASACARRISSAADTRSRAR